MGEHKNNYIEALASESQLGRIRYESHNVG